MYVRMYTDTYRITGIFGGHFNLAVILIWRFGEYCLDRQIKITPLFLIAHFLLICSAWPICSSIDNRGASTIVWFKYFKQQEKPTLE